MKVKDCMNPRAVAVGAFEPVAVAARVMARQNVGMLPVRDAAAERHAGDGHLRGGGASGA